MEYVQMNSIFILAILMVEIVVLIVLYPIATVTFALVTGIKQIIQSSSLRILVTYQYIRDSVFDNYLNMLVYYTGCSIAGDGFCDDSTNDGRCDFDGGDCCLPNINNQYCSFCICYADNPEGKFLSQTILKITQK